MIGHGARHRAQRPAQRLLGQQLRDVAHAGGEAGGPIPPGRIACQQRAVRLHVRAAARRVHHHVLHARILERRDGAPGEGERGRVLARVRVERSAASLGTRSHDLEPVAGQHPRGGAVVRAEDRLLDAAGEQAHAAAPRALGRGHLGERGPVRTGGQGRQQWLPVSEGARQQAQQPGAADQPLETAHLVEAQAARGQPQQARVRQEQREVEPPEEAAQQPARALALDLAARRLDQLPVGHARRAHRLARAAAETEIQVRDRGVGQADAALGQRLDEHDAPARGIHLGTELGERRAVGQAEPAVHATVDTLHALPVKREGRGRTLGGGRGVGHRLRSLPRSVRD